MGDAVELGPDPLAETWEELVVRLGRIPARSNLPREEIIRMARSFFYLGVSQAIAPMVQGFGELSRGETTLQTICDVAFAIGDAVTESKVASLPQIIATIKAHGRG